MNPDLVPMLLDVSVDPCDGSVHPSLQYVLIRGFTAMGWEQPKAASEDMAMEILKMVRPKLASGGTVEPSGQPLVGERPLCPPPRLDAGGDVRERIARSIWEAQHECIKTPGPIAASLSWRSKRVPDVFWDGYLRDADAALSALSTPSDTANESAEARLRGALNSLRNEVKGVWSIEETALREGIGNTNFNCVQRRLDEADIALSAGGDEATKSEGGDQ